MAAEAAAAAVGNRSFLCAKTRQLCMSASPFVMAACVRYISRSSITGQPFPDFGGAS
jgi:hypothetical protein